MHPARHRARRRGGAGQGRQAMTAVVVETTHKAELELGPSVEGGRVLWSSASGLTKADPNSVGGCLRRWFYETVMGLRQPSTPAQETGTKLHGAIEDPLVRGLPLVSQLALAGRAFIEPAGPGILIEHP